MQRDKIEYQKYISINEGLELWSEIPLNFKLKKRQTIRKNVLYFGMLKLGSLRCQSLKQPYYKNLHHPLLHESSS